MNSNNFEPPEIIFFDAAGTLFRVRGSVGQVYARLAESQGAAPLSRRQVDVLDGAFAQAFHRRAPLLFPGANRDELSGLERGWWRAVVEETFSGLDLNVSDHLFNQIYDFFSTAGAWQLEPDCRQTLETLSERGFRLGVISNFDSRLEPLLRDFQLAHHFSTIVVSNQVGAAKPDPEIFRLALKAARCEPWRALHVGDNPIEDYRAALEAGMQALLYVPRGEPPPEVCCVRSLGELVALRA